MRTQEELSQTAIDEIIEGYNPLKAASTCREKTWVLFERPSVSVGGKFYVRLLLSDTPNLLCIETLTWAMAQN